MKHSILRKPLELDMKYCSSMLDMIARVRSGRDAGTIRHSDFFDPRYPLSKASYWIVAKIFISTLTGLRLSQGLNKTFCAPRFSLSLHNRN